MCCLCVPAAIPTPNPLQVTFGTVVSAGAAKDTDKWGVSAACRPSLRGIVLNAFPKFPGFIEYCTPEEDEKRDRLRQVVAQYADLQQVCACDPTAPAQVHMLPDRQLSCINGAFVLLMLISSLVGLEPVQFRHQQCRIVTMLVLLMHRLCLCSCDSCSSR
jgi:hypothetical protein